ncbi:hypothetical protein BDN67DRAFT_1011650 [Paxillus ammoniavirescens]|nr:hypothetical protein BDN67DRAFT_1011650 [Paxillus ammoniavirescens]
MAFGFSENMHPPKGWKPPARPNASFRASALAQDWPAQFKYPPLPLAACNPPVLAPTAIDDVAARPAIPPRHSDPSPSVPTVTHSPFEAPAPLASASSFTPLSSRAGVDQSPYWTQSHPSGSMPTFSNTSVNHPLSLDTVDISTAVHQNVHAPSTVATTPCLFASEQVDQFPGPAPLTGLPSSYAFSFTWDPWLQSIGTRYMTQQSDGAQYHPQYQNNYNHPQYTQSTPLVNAPQSFDTVNLPSVVHHGISAPSRIVPTPYLLPCEDVAQLSGLASLTGLPNSDEFTFPCDPQPQRYNETTLSLQEQGAHFQSDQQNLTVYHVPSEVTLPPVPAREQTTEVCVEDFNSLEDYFAAARASEELEDQLGHLERFTTGASSSQHQDSAATQPQPGHENHLSSVDEPPESHASDSDEFAAALVLSIIAPPRPVKKMGTRGYKACASTDASMATSVAQPTYGWCGSQASSSTHSISPSYAPAQSMPTAGPSSGQGPSTNHRGQKRSSNDLESNDEGHQKRPRLQTTNGIERRWCGTCQESVAKDRMSVHNRSRKHTGVGRYFCRICMKVGGGCRGQSRKDSLKRHIIQQHAHDFPLIWETFPSILDPYYANEGRQDWEVLLGPPQQ